MQLEDVLAGAPEETGAAVIRAPSWRRALPWGVSAAAIVAAMVATTQWAPWRMVSAPAPHASERRAGRGRVASQSVSESQ